MFDVHFLVCRGAAARKREEQEWQNLSEGVLRRLSKLEGLARPACLAGTAQRPGRHGAKATVLSGPPLSQDTLKRETDRYYISHVKPGKAFGELDHPDSKSELFRSLDGRNVSHQVGDTQRHLTIRLRLGGSAPPPQQLGPACTPPTREERSPVDMGNDPETNAVASLPAWVASQ